MPVALLTDEQLDALLEKAAERGAQRALEATRASELTTAEAAELLGCSTKTVRRRVKDGTLVPARRHGKDYRFTRTAIEAAKRGPPVSPAAAAALASLGIK